MTETGHSGRFQVRLARLLRCTRFGAVPGTESV